MSSRHTQFFTRSPSFRSKTLALALAVASGATISAGAEAARLGHARVVSAPGEALRVAVPVVELTPEESQSLQVSLADAADWQRAGLTPPAPLASLSLQGQAGGDAGRRNFILSSSQPLQGDSVDVLLNLRSGAGQRQVQVTILVPRGGGAGPVQAARVGQPAAAAPSASGAQVKVRQGDTLYAIAQRNPIAGANIYQTLVALWRANPEAFSGDNMNRLKAGTSLTLPDADAARAIDPAEARRIYIEQVEAYARYRAGLGQSAGGTSVSAGSASAGKVTGGDTPAGANPESSQDRLRLSGAAAAGQGGANGGQSAADAKADASTSEGRALADARERVDTLQSNVEALKQASGMRDPSSDGAVSAAGMAAGAAAAALAGAIPGSGSGSADAGSGGASGASGGAAPGTPGAAAATAGAAAGGTAAAGETSPASAGAAAPSAQGGAAASGGAAGAATAKPEAGVVEKATAAVKKEAADANMPSWLVDNLLVIVTAILALLVFIIAWALRRAGTRRGEDNEESPYGEPQPLDNDALNKRLHTINLDLDQQASDEPRPGGRS